MRGYSKNIYEGPMDVDNEGADYGSGGQIERDEGSKTGTTLIA